MILGTHNSLSYLNPKQWYLRFLRHTAQCQDLTIEEQYNYGVRYFDIRIKFDKSGSVKSGHGIMTYDVDIFKILDFLNSKGDCVVRLGLENKKCKKFDFIVNDFFELSNSIKNSYTDLIIDYIWIKHTYRSYNWDNACCDWVGGMSPSKKSIDAYQLFPFKGKLRYLIYPNPRKFAKADNGMWRSFCYDKEEYVLFDFVNI